MNRNQTRNVMIAVIIGVAAIAGCSSTEDTVTPATAVESYTSSTALSTTRASTTTISTTTIPPATPAPTTPPPPSTEPAMTPSQQQAVRKAESYLSSMSFSRQGLIDQLIYEKFSSADATFAVDHITVDWNAQAAGKAESYLSSMSFSCQGLIDQLIYEEFTPEQASYGANQTGIC